MQTYGTLTELYEHKLKYPFYDLSYFEDYTHNLFLSSIINYKKLKSLSGIEKFSYTSIILDDRYDPTDINNELQVLNKSNIVEIYLKTCLPFRIKNFLKIKKLNKLVLVDEKHYFFDKKQIKYICNLNTMLNGKIN